MSLNIERIKKILKENSLRVTKTRIAVAHVLIEGSHQFLTSEDIYSRISKKKYVTCDLVSVYRILTTFEKLNIIKKIEFNNEAARYSLVELKCKTGKIHEHYFKCIECLTIEAFSDCFVSKKEKELESSGYRNLSHHLEISGLCPTCAA